MNLLTMYAFAKSLRKEDQVRRYTIQPGEAGWEVLTQHDESVERACYQDWHRVEFRRRMMVLELAALKENGWIEEPA